MGEGGCANLDGPLAVHGRRIKAGVKRRGDDAFVFSQYAATVFSWKTKTNEQRRSEVVSLDSHVSLDYLLTWGWPGSWPKTQATALGNQ